MSIDAAVAARLLAAWQAAGAERLAALDGMPVPGLIPLRCRFQQLRDPEAPDGPWDAGLDEATWLEILNREDAGDQAITGNDHRHAAALFTELLAVEPSATHRVVTVNARIGLGDAGLAVADTESAAREYEAALSLARTDRYRFGQLRALTGLGYLTLMQHSASAALARFREAAAIAAAIGDRGYAASAVLGAGECRERLGDLDDAVRLGTEAYADFAGMRSAVGAGTAAQRLGAVLHRLGRRREAREWYERARAEFTAAGNPMGITNVLSGLGDLLLDGDPPDPDAAERVYREGLEVATDVGLRLSRAHALQDLARVALVRGDLTAAQERFRVSLAAYQEVDDLLGMSNAHDKLARVLARLGREQDALRVRMDAIRAVEEYRATHRDERSQREYRDRFRAAYARALDAATGLGAAGSFCVAAEGLAGRRLAGLFAAYAQVAAGAPAPKAGGLAFLQELLVRADQRLVEDRRARQSATQPTPGAQPPPATQPPPVASAARRERVIRLLGAVGITGTLAPQAEASLDDLLATLYLPPADEGGELLAALPAGCHVLQVLLDPVDESLLRWLWRDPDGRATVGACELPGSVAGLIAVCREGGAERAGLRMRDLAPLAALLPPGMRAELARPGPTVRKVLLVPVGDLWLVPWAGVPVTADQVLGELAAVAVCPSLTVQRQLRLRGAPVRGTAQEQPGQPGQLRQPWEADVWRSPLVGRHLLEELASDPNWAVTPAPDAAAARERLRNGRDVMVVAGHGRPSRGLEHYLELDHGEWLLLADLIGARPPVHLALIACWGGAVPGGGTTDPLSIATLALAARSAEVLATVGELADSDLAAPYVARVLASLPLLPLPEALHEATRWFLAQRGTRSELIHHWAPLTAFGTFY